MKDIISRLTSRKFLLAVFAVLIALFNDRFLHLNGDQISLIRDAILAFITAEGIADAVTRYTNIPSVDEGQ